MNLSKLNDHKRIGVHKNDAPKEYDKNCDVIPNKFTKNSNESKGDKLGNE